MYGQTNLKTHQKLIFQSFLF